MTLLARGSLPWPARLAGQPVCRGNLTGQAPIDAPRLRVTAWPRSAPDGSLRLSIECEPYPKGGRRRSRAAAPRI
jgi:hypothetical protein